VDRAELKEKKRNANKARQRTERLLYRPWAGSRPALLLSWHAVASYQKSDIKSDAKREVNHAREKGTWSRIANFLFESKDTHRFLGRVQAPYPSCF
jgi:hypothetical protein